MGSIKAFIELLKRLFGFGEKLAENKGQKIEHQTEAIKAKASLKAEKAENKEDRISTEYEQKKEIDKWANRVKLFDTSRRNKKRSINDIERIIKSGGVVESTMLVKGEKRRDDVIMIHCVINGKKEVIK